jgi:hypothetical protein
MAPWCFEECPTCNRETRHRFDLETAREDFLRAFCEGCGAVVVIVGEDAGPGPTDLFEGPRR